jgi:hypothetical protein
MFGLLQVCFTLAIVGFCIESEFDKDPSDITLFYYAVIFCEISIVLDQMAHSLFAVKMWVISRKLEDSIDNKAYVLLVAQLVSCALF